jgi:putative transposase
MPGSNVTPMEQINRFVMLARSGRFTITELCEQFGICRKTGYKYLARYDAEGLIWIAPSKSPPASVCERDGREGGGADTVGTPGAVHRTRSPKKLRRVLEVKHGVEHDRRDPASTWTECATTTAAGCRHASNDGLTQANQPNHVWTVDFKGWFILGKQQRCDPLTGCDFYSHFILACRARPNQQLGGTQSALKALTRQSGLPEIIRCDLGSPFASNGSGRLSSLSLWWIEQGIEVEFARPASPPPG